MIIYRRNRHTVSRNVNFKEPLFYRFEGTSAKIPLDLPEKKPLASSPL